MQRIDLSGLPWCPADTTIAPPRIFGLVTRSNDECTGLAVGATATSMSSHSNRWDVSVDDDAVRIERQPGEAFYSAQGRPSFVLRVASEAGTLKNWVMTYA